MSSRQISFSPLNSTIIFRPLFFEATCETTPYSFLISCTIKSSLVSRHGAGHNLQIYLTGEVYIWQRGRDGAVTLRV